MARRGARAAFYEGLLSYPLVAALAGFRRRRPRRHGRPHDGRRLHRPGSDLAEVDPQPPQPALRGNVRTEQQGPVPISRHASTRRARSTTSGTTPARSTPRAIGPSTSRRSCPTTARCSSARRAICCSRTAASPSCCRDDELSGALKDFETHVGTHRRTRDDHYHTSSSTPAWARAKPPRRSNTRAI